MKDLKQLTQDQLHERHFDLMLDIAYNTVSIKSHQKTVDEAVAELELIDDELESRENPKLRSI